MKETESDVQWILEHSGAMDVMVAPGEGRLFMAAGEESWLPILGPTACAVNRTLIRRGLMNTNRHTVVDLAELGPAVGMVSAISKNSPIVLAVRRIVKFGLADITQDGLVVQERVLPSKRGQMLQRPAGSG